MVTFPEIMFKKNKERTREMKKTKTLIVMLLAFAMIFSLAACGEKTPTNNGDNNLPNNNNNKPDGGQPKLTAAQLMQTSQENSAALTSYDMSMDYTINVNIAMAGESMDMEMLLNMNASVFSDPLRMYMDMTFDMGAEGRESMTMYIDQTEDGLVGYYNYGDYWLSESLGTVDVDDVFESNGASGVDSYIELTKNFEIVGADTINGSAATKISGTITGDDIFALIDNMGTFDGYDITTDLITSIGSIPVTYWVDDAMQCVVRCEVNMRDFMKQLMVSTLSPEAYGLTDSDYEININACDMVMELSNFNNATDFTVPEAALAA